MAPVRKRTALRARASRANDPRGKYAPPPTSADTTTAPDDLLPDADQSPADTHTGPAAGKRSAETAFGFDSNEGFKVSKKDKRTIRHNQLLAKVQDADARVGKKKLKRRRPGKKLATNLDSLADALPEMEDDAGGEDEDDDWEGISEDEENDGGMAGVEGFRKVKRRRRTPGGADAANRMKMTSLRHRPGAMKRKHRMEQGEMERFGRNLAQMVGSGQANVSDGKSSVAKGRQGDGSKSSGGEDAGGGAASQSDRWAALRRFIGGTMEQNQAFAGSK
ncbi:hypothetical protein D0864_00038 [Hortaea werneckii]|uniref:Ribosome biogenesis protein SLX9 n=1 Tax=Hortaea werneckii TaxID=91943 RepID=A0A3M7HP15_HORWE|nr:hypothetical protein KC338_g6066 [Hortaea werneckii]KAI7294631.1 hypothetical protein KC352_g1069 [Hortaea werneckii]KAI7684137.1 hypothetical protein KC319_g91 [Hortaea werneckii]KAI7724119.1 hypothetical protein KC322_g283 [Hortaea werneckii]RMZ07458.1 hypothetical protein D0862_04266 [Hortaea werneckii]